jgi:hypothetical protein
MSGYIGLRQLTEQERNELRRWAQSRTLPAGDVFRARLVLALADGHSYSWIEGELGTSRPTIARWKERFEKHGLPGLDPQHKGRASPRCSAGARAAASAGALHGQQRSQLEEKAADIIALYMKSTPARGGVLRR